MKALFRPSRTVGGIDDALLARVEKQAWFHRHPRGWPILLFFIISVGTVVSVMAMERADRQRRDVELDRNATEIASGLQRRAAENVALLRAGAALFASRDRVSFEEFNDFASGLYRQGEYHGARGMGWAKLLRVADVSSFELDMRETGRRDYLIFPRPDPTRRYATPVVYALSSPGVEPRSSGYDMYSDGTRRLAMDTALRRDQPIATGPVNLIGDRDRPDIVGFLIYMPVFGNRTAAHAAQGFVFSVFRAEEFLDSAAELYRNRQVEVAIYDTRLEPGRLLAWRQVPGETGASLDRTIPIAGRDWILRISTKHSRTLTILSRVTLFFGELVALLVMFIARIITRRAAEDRQVLEALSRQAAIRTSLTRELNHRVKNTLANVLSIVSLTRRRASGLDDFAESLTARLRALSATHDLLSQSDWTDAPVGAIVRSELAPYMEGSDANVAMDGPAINLAPNDALSLGLAIHELATNAAKYGALSRPGGNVAVDWRLLSNDVAEVHWRETGGPPVSPPTKRGFGRDLIEKIVSHELRSQVVLEFQPEGVECRLQVPVRKAGAFTLRRGA